MSIDVEQLVAGIHDYLQRAFAPLAGRIKSLEERAPARGEPGERGLPGEAGLNGKDGADGRSMTLEDVRPLIEEHLAAIAIPKDGVDGKHGKDGADGADGRSIMLEDVRPIIEIELAKWALDFERRAQDIVQRTIDRIEKPKDGAPGAAGKDGRDGFGFDDLQVIHDGERAVTLRFVRGEAVKEFALVIPAVIERGIFKQGQAYEQGDGATFGGSFWIAQRRTEDKPGESDAWRLAVKKGRDGRDGEKGERGPEGQPGRAAVAPAQLLTGAIR